MNLEEGDLVLCTVERIEKTIVFVKIHHEGNDYEGSITTSEIAPGRIRNIRDYVVPKKKIVCKILRIKGKNIELSLRRVSQKETKEVIAQYSQEKSYISILKSVLGKDAEEAVKKILEKGSVYDFFEESKEDVKKLENLVGKNNAKKIFDILASEKPKRAVIKRVMSLKSTAPNGLELIKNILGKIKDLEIRYISAGKYGIKSEDENLKKADKKIKDVVAEVEKEAKKDALEFSISEK